MNIPFVQKRQARWNRLDELIKKISTHKITSLSKTELIEFSVLYRRLLGDLSLARAEQMPGDLIGFLNDLAGRSYHQIYRPKQTKIQQFKSFIRELPSLIRQNMQIILFSALLMSMGWLLGFFGYLTAPEIVTHFIPEGIAKKVLLDYQHNTWFNNPLAARPYLSAFIMFNNIYVSVMAFAGGMLLGSYTIYIIVSNGFFLGVLAAVFEQGGYSLSFWAMILPHGVIELTAITLASAAGLLLARTLLFPGELSRADALKQYAQNGAKLFAGAVILLIVAGLIEGYLSTINRMVIPEYIRLIFGLLTAVLLVMYFNLDKFKNPEKTLIMKVCDKFE